MSLWWHSHQQHWLIGKHRCEQGAEEGQERAGALQGRRYQERVMLQKENISFLLLGLGLVEVLGEERVIQHCALWRIYLVIRHVNSFLV